MVVNYWNPEQFGLGCQKEHNIYILNLYESWVYDLLGLSFRASLFFNGKILPKNKVKIQNSKMIFKGFKWFSRNFKWSDLYFLYLCSQKNTRLTILNLFIFSMSFGIFVSFQKKKSEIMSFQFHTHVYM
jgi:hypothetical protein